MADANPVPELTWVPTGAELTELLGRAEAGDEVALARLRPVLAHPEGIAALGGDLAAGVLQGLITSVAGNDALKKEAVLAKLAAIRREIGADGGGPLEQLLVEQIVICWLHVHKLETVALGFPSRPLPPVMQRALKACDQRYQSAIKTLAQVRQLVGQVRPKGPKQGRSPRS